jgi:hypothetical protein
VMVGLVEAGPLFGLILVTTGKAPKRLADNSNQAAEEIEKYMNFTKVLLKDLSRTDRCKENRPKSACGIERASIAIFYALGKAFGLWSPRPCVELTGKVAF